MAISDFVQDQFTSFRIIMSGPERDVRPVPPNLPSSLEPLWRHGYIQEVVSGPRSKLYKCAFCNNRGWGEKTKLSNVRKHFKATCPSVPHVRGWPDEVSTVGFPSHFKWRYVSFAFQMIFGNKRPRGDQTGIQSKLLPPGSHYESVLDSAITRWFYESARPFLLVEDEGLREFVKLASRNCYFLPSRKQVRRRVRLIYSSAFCDSYRKLTECVGA